MKKTISILTGIVLCAAIVITIGTTTSRKSNVSATRDYMTVNQKAVTEKTDKEVHYISGMIAKRNKSELILDSDLIICGTVLDFLDSKWSNEGFVRSGISNILQTDVIISIDDIIYGDCENDTVAVRINKGEDENTIVYSDGYPDFEIGEKVLLFLARDDSDVATDEDYYVICGMLQGKYNLDENSQTFNSHNSGNTSIYTNELASEPGDIDMSTFEQRVIDEKNANPDYKEQKQ